MGDATGFKAFLDRNLAGKRERAAVEVDQQAHQLASDIRAAAPKKSGALAASVRVEQVGPLRRRVRAGGPLTTRPVRDGATKAYDYANATEFGTEKEAAEPFFYTTVRRKASGIKRAIGGALKSGDGTT